ncbi:MAG: MATE family efflux transporter, partial [Clostridiales bacterium]|nr:MATE family efflux transporter [Clostridiales bacterium]
MAKNYEIDMCNGPIFKKLVFFSVPLIISNLLQLLFNAADIIVVGQYAGQQSLAAVGSTTALINLLVNLFVGLSIGANVVTAQLFGEKNEKDVSLAVHTSITISIIGGFILAVVGAICSKTILILMDSPEDVINLSTLYLRIYFLGMPFTMLYNFGSSILRAIGDTRRPLYYLSIAGVINVILNLLFVIVFHLDVAGVALATIISQAISAFFVIRCLMKSTGCYRLDLKKLKIDQNKLNRIFRIGIPAGVQGIVFSISNILI